jgi:hypothetical protein
MTLTKKSLKRLSESMWIRLTEGQEHAILERFGTEPEPYEWSEQDVVTQIQNFLGCGEFVKPLQDSCARILRS